MAGSAITAAAASRTFFIQYLLVEEFQRGASRRTELRKRGNSTRRFLHSPPNGAFSDALPPKCGPDVTVPPAGRPNSALEGDYLKFLQLSIRNFRSCRSALWARSCRR